jgi:HK97 gp10 family phage protein
MPRIRMRIQMNRIPEVVAEMNGGAHKARDEAAQRIADLARDTVAVDTGETKESIRVNAGSVSVDGAGLFLEFGTVKMQAQPFLGPAAEQVRQEMDGIFRKWMAGGYSGG